MPSTKDLPAERIILGIDPGTTIMGYGVIRCRGKSQVELVEMGALHMSKIKDHALKLKRIFDRVSALIETHAPDDLAVEAPFFGQNVQSMLKLGRAQGVALAAALAHEIPVAEYAPRREAGGNRKWCGVQGASGRHGAADAQDSDGGHAQGFGRHGWLGGGLVPPLSAGHAQNAAWRRGLEGVFGGQSGPDSQIIALFSSAKSLTINDCNIKIMFFT